MKERLCERRLPAWPNLFWQSCVNTSETGIYYLESINGQWCKVTKYIYSSTVLKHNFEVLVLYQRISILSYFVLLPHYKPEVKSVLLLHYMYVTPLVTLQIWINDVK